MKDSHSELRRSLAKETLSKHGYGKMKEVADKEVRKGIGEHEKSEHGGKKTKLKLKDGGEAKGKAPKSRLDRKNRATGGRNKGHKDAKVKINILNAGGGKQPMPMSPPSAMGAAPHAPMPMPPPQAPAAPPMGGAGAPPMGSGMPARPMPGMAPQQGRPFKGGGPVRSKGEHPHLEGGAGGGLGRLEKAAAQKKRK